MNAEAVLSSPKFNRLMLWLGAIVLAAGVLVLVSSLVGGTDQRREGNQKGFHPTLPAKQIPLKTASGQTVTRYEQLGPQIRSALRTFLATAVPRKNLDKSWNVISPGMRKGYTRESWAHAKALPIVPYPVANPDRVNYYLDYASTEEILLDVGVYAKPSLKVRSQQFRIGLVPVGKGANKRWLVDYWMPLWTPPLPVN
jgi:hypothetical protein